MQFTFTSLTYVFPVLYLCLGWAVSLLCIMTCALSPQENAFDILVEERVFKWQFQIWMKAIICGQVAWLLHDALHDCSKRLSLPCQKTKDIKSLVKSASLAFLGGCSEWILIMPLSLIVHWRRSICTEHPAPTVRSCIKSDLITVRSFGTKSCMTQMSRENSSLPTYLSCREAQGKRHMKCIRLIL